MGPRKAVPNHFGTRYQLRVRQFFHGLGGWGGGSRVCSGGNVSDGGNVSGGNVSDGERWEAADEASITCYSPPAVQPGS